MQPKKQTNQSSRQQSTWRFTSPNSRSVLGIKPQSKKKNPENLKSNESKVKRTSFSSSLKLKAQSLKQTPSTKSFIQNQQQDSKINQKQKLKHNSQPISSAAMFNYLNEEQKEQQQYRMAQFQEQRWNRQSQIGTQSRIMKQYERYFGDAENVFYQDSSMIKELETINWCWKKALVAFLINLIIWIFLRSTSPYPGPCPRHATCGVYINCHQGYVYSEKHEACLIDPQVTEFALALMNSVIEDMKLQYGQKECSIPQKITQKQLQQHLSPPKKSMKQIFKLLDILQSQDFMLLRTQLSRLFKDRNNQILAGFDIDYLNRVYPLEKKYTITCKMDLFYKNNFQQFLAIVAIIVCLIIFSLFKLSQSLYFRKGRRIYEYLKKQTIENKQIRFQDYKTQIEQKFNSSKVISEQLWMLINDFRIREKKIGCYEENEGIVWKVMGRV